MPLPAMDGDTVAKIRSLHAKGVAKREIGRQLGIAESTVRMKLNDQRVVKKEEVIVCELPSSIKQRLRKNPMSVEQLADAFDCKPSLIREALATMKKSGVMLLETVDGRYDLGTTDLIEPGSSKLKSGAGGKTRIGFTSDNHLCNKHSRLDVLRKAYKHFSDVGITDVYNAGNWIDGEARFNKTELVTAPGMDNQLDYFINEFPMHEEITTHYIAGDDHEGWYSQREGIDIGRYLQMRAEKAGRHDLHYLGYGECDVRLAYGGGESVMRVVHPGGGSAYAISYTDQKRVESYQGGEKPQIELVGHYHKFNHGFPREVHTIQGGCTCDQTMFMRKKRLQAHVGYCIINIDQEQGGAVTRCAVEWYPSFDRSYYEARF